MKEVRGERRERRSIECLCTYASCEQHKRKNVNKEKRKKSASEKKSKRLCLFFFNILKLKEKKNYIFAGHSPLL